MDPESKVADDDENSSEDNTMDDEDWNLDNAYEASDGGSNHINRSKTPESIEECADVASVEELLISSGSSTPQEATPVSTPGCGYVYPNLDAVNL